MRRILARSRVAGVALAVATMVVGTGCEALVVQHVQDARTGAGLPQLPQSAYLHDVARVIVTEDCLSSDGGPIEPIDPMLYYTGEPAVAMVHLEERARFDPDLAPEAQEAAATNEIWARWQDNPAITDPRWDDMAVVQYGCVLSDDNGHPYVDLYMALVLRDRP
jgi:hypothetical protein